ncbi:MAG: hypothetical protein IKP50_00280 [Bacilli bacterium]|nr:hypothetical protein [Bacilli bacterium]
MVRYSECKLGYKYALTQKGFEEGRVRAKFDTNNSNYKQYLHYVPTKWIQEGYVVEVKEN